MLQVMAMAQRKALCHCEAVFANTLVNKATTASLGTAVEMTPGTYAIVLYLIAILRCEGVNVAICRPKP